ncbi:MAG: hypothetical protein NC084_07110 [Bacteroides sp.]|nr:hypothetical protein [Bacteroides sp.]
MTSPDLISVESSSKLAAEAVIISMEAVSAAINSARMESLNVFFMVLSSCK